MEQQNVVVGPNPTVVVETVSSDLRAAGWDRSEIMAKTDGDKLNLAVDGDRVVISCDESLILYLPRQTALNVDRVAGDANLQALLGPLVLGPVAGDLSTNDLGRVTLENISGDASFRGVGALEVQSISGDLSLRGGRGHCSIDSIGGDATIHDLDGGLTIKKVGSDLNLSKVRGGVESSSGIGGDASVRDVEGDVTLKSVGSDLYLRNVRGAVEANAGADIALYLVPMANQEYRLNSGDDMLVRLPVDANVELHLSGSSPEDIQVDFPGVTLDNKQPTAEVTIGNGAAKMFLNSGGDLLVTSQAEKWDSAADFGFGMSDQFVWPEIPPIPPIPPIPALSPEFTERINRRTREAVERAQSRIEAANRRTGLRVEAAMRRAEAKARAAEARVRRGPVNFQVNRWKWDLAPQGPEARGEPVSDGERLTILKMLQEKKITLEEAEKLLAALEGR